MFQKFPSRIGCWMQKRQVCPLFRRSLRWPPASGMAGQREKNSWPFKVPMIPLFKYISLSFCHLPLFCFLVLPASLSFPSFLICLSCPTHSTALSRHLSCCLSRFPFLSRFTLSISVLLHLSCVSTHSLPRLPPLPSALLEAKTPHDAWRWEGEWVGPGAAVPPLGACVNVW